jgi:hypothetical protein
VAEEAPREETDVAAVHAETRTAVVPQGQGFAERTRQRAKFASRNAIRDAQAAPSPGEERSLRRGAPSPTGSGQAGQKSFLGFLVNHNHPSPLCFL